MLKKLYLVLLMLAAAPVAYAETDAENDYHSFDDSYVSVDDSSISIDEISVDEIESEILRTSEQNDDDEQDADCEESTETEVSVSNSASAADVVTEEQAFAIGVESGKRFEETYKIFGQGKIFEHIQQDSRKSLELLNFFKKASRGTQDWRIDERLGKAFIKGLEQQMQKINIKDFAKKARLTEGQAILLIDVSITIYRCFVLPTMEQRLQAFKKEFARLKPPVLKELPALAPLLDWPRQLKSVKISKQEAFKCGQELVKLLFDQILLLGQGSYFERLNDMLVRARVIKDVCMKAIPKPMPKESVHAVIEGVEAALKAMDIHAFVKNAHLTAEQAQIVIKAYNFVCTHASGMVKTNLKELDLYHQRHFMEYMQFGQEIMPMIYAACPALTEAQSLSAYRVV